MSTKLDRDWLRNFVAQRCANQLPEDKDYLIDARLASVLRANRLRGLSELITELRVAPRGDLADQVVDALTTHETSFFRDRRFFAAMRSEILPGLIEANRDRKQLTVWSAACSSGQEVYSVAMMMDGEFPELADWSLRMFATDIAPATLERARNGRFSRIEASRGLTPEYSNRYLRPVGREFEVVPRLRDRVQFSLLNLDSHWPALPAMDLLMLRNVLIYFDDQTKARVLDRARRQLTKNGVLVLGAQEQVSGPTQLERELQGGYPVFKARRLLGDFAA